MIRLLHHLTAARKRAITFTTMTFFNRKVPIRFSLCSMLEAKAFFYSPRLSRGLLLR